MLRVTIISVDPPKHAFIIAGEAEYQKRIKDNVNLSYRELRPAKRSSISDSVAREQDTELVLEAVQPGEFLIALSEHGKSFTSPALASELQKLMNRGHSHLVFAVGGNFGWSDKISSRANLLLSLSPLTFTAEFSRLILIEQLYRAFSILKGSSYHK